MSEKQKFFMEIPNELYDYITEESLKTGVPKVRIVIRILKEYIKKHRGK